MDAYLCFLFWSSHRLLNCGRGLEKCTAEWDKQSFGFLSRETKKGNPRKQKYGETVEEDL